MSLPGLWLGGDQFCLTCDEPTNSNGSPTCQCTPRVICRRLPLPPITVNGRYPLHLVIKDRKLWDEEQYVCNLIRYNKEKTDYNQALDLGEEIETDYEEEGDFRIEHKRGLFIAPINDCLEERRCEQAWQRYRTDHPTLSQGVNAPRDGVGPGTFHRFLDLPPELRMQIWSFALPNTQGMEIRQWQFVYETGALDGFAELRPLDTRFLAVNRQLYHEELRTLYSSATFVVDIDGSNDSVPLLIRESTGSLGPRPTAYIKRWHLIIVLTDPMQDRLVLPQLQKVHAVMRQCKSLDIVRFSWVTTIDYASGHHEYIRQFESMLHIFKDLRSVREVTFTKNSWDVKRYPRLTKRYRTMTVVGLASKNVRRAIEASMKSPIS